MKEEGTGGMGGAAAAGDRGALSRLRVGRGRRASPPTGPAAEAGTEVASVPVQLSGAETMHELNETLRSITGGMHAHFTGPGVALEVTLGRQQELPIHEAHTAGLTRLFRHAAGTIGARSTPGEAGASTATGLGSPDPCGSRLPGTLERLARRTPAPRAALLDGVGRGRAEGTEAYAGTGAHSGSAPDRHAQSMPCFRSPSSCYRGTAGSQ
ncbi:hypothetical protein [Streptomyces sp. NPDC018000]|uniref:hypothetical protein n=1 Tax=Streptomyces sp. NPDC018000 TaxID=3365028 RepID=UPI003793CCE8